MNTLNGFAALRMRREVRLLSVLMTRVGLSILKRRPEKCIEIKVDAQPYPVSLGAWYYHRTGSIMHELKGSVLDRFLLLKQGKRWNAMPVPNVNIAGEYFFSHIILISLT